ncbi:QcrA and Rieske domain-containing protein [Rhizomonospora bruguierae]|uniref:QcrA and Rieske domain-containing protein n=1 Tax=Rhizomonospora bruguierae TaxID=1581705 RepID=UPI001BCE3AEA|nr:Rieske 2Fe-2S domain-containing protein [Micromonospora sp. NBRC 107566]
MSGPRDPFAGQRGRARWVRAFFALTVLGAAGFAAAYTAGGNTQLLGVALAVAFGGLAAGLAVWGRGLLPSGGYVEERPILGRHREERRVLAETAGGAESPIRRRGLVGALVTAGGALGLALLFPLRSLLEFRPGNRPIGMVRHTVWRAGGIRLVTPEGKPVRPGDISPGTVQIVVPEGHADDGDAPAFLVRLDVRRLRKGPPAATVGDLAAFSVLCTHAGCPVALYEKGTGRMLCPCHQSAFDLWNAARAVAGPAARPLPGLPIEVGPDGYLRASGDFTAPPGAGFWDLPPGGVP